MVAELGASMTTAAPGDEGLMVVIVPRDEDGSAVKVPARALGRGVGNHTGRPEEFNWLVGTQLRAASPHLEKRVDSAPVTLSRCRGKRCLPRDRVRIAVRLITTDNRAYEADRDVNVRPPFPPRNNVLPYPAPVPGTPIPGTHPGTPAIPTVPPGGRQPLLPEKPPPGVPPAIPPGVEELPPPAPLDRVRNCCRP